MKQQPAWKKRLYEIIFESDTRSGKTFDIFLLIIIVLSTAVVILESIPNQSEQTIRLFIFLEWLFTILFTIEYALRLLVVKHRGRYMLSFFGIVDLLSILPSYVALVFSGAQALLVIRIIRLLRIFRIFKLTQLVGASNTLLSAINSSRHKISVFLVTVIMSVTIAGTLMFLIEGPVNGFTSIPTSIYWAIVTMTTVGYGDIAPQTATGQAIASLIMILGYGIIALPTGIVSAEMIALKSKEKLTTQVCPHCFKDGHDADAHYCKYCSGVLNE